MCAAAAARDNNITMILYRTVWCGARRRPPERRRCRSPFQGPPRGRTAAQRRAQKLRTGVPAVAAPEVFFRVRSFRGLPYFISTGTKQVYFIFDGTVFLIFLNPNGLDVMRLILLGFDVGTKY